MSRLGRDYLRVGYYTDSYFPDHSIRFIAINDCVDSDDGENELAPFRNVMKNISHSGKVSNDFSLFRRFCRINRCFRCSCGKFAMPAHMQMWLPPPAFGDGSPPVPVAGISAASV